jgi:hypothetical protein
MVLVSCVIHASAGSAVTGYEVVREDAGHHDAVAHHARGAEERGDARSLAGTRADALALSGVRH